MNSTALNCSSCNAPLAPGALRCDYCGKATPAGAALRRRPVAVAPAYVPVQGPGAYLYTPSKRGPVRLATLLPAIARCFAKYVDFSGRASLAEYWWWVALQFGVSWGSYAVDVALHRSQQANTWYMWWLFLTFIPGLAVTARRLHDVRRSGWNMLWSITGIGALVVFYWLTLPSDAAPENPWGPPERI